MVQKFSVRELVTRMSSLSGKSVLVTGATGFIGQHIVQFLVRAGAEVHVLSHRKNSHPAIKFPDLVQSHRGDLLDRVSLEKIFRKCRPKKVIHAAAVVNLERSFEVAKNCIHLNVEGTLNLLEILNGEAGAAGGALENFVYLSTSEVYGHQRESFREELRELPPSPYSITKLAGENFCRLYHEIYGVPTTVLRLSTCYGPGQAARRLIPSIIQAAIKNSSIQLHCGPQKRDFIYVEDVVKGMIKAAQNPKAVGQLINLGQEQTVTVKTVVETIKKLTRSRFAVEYKEVKNQRPNEILNWSSSSKKAKRILNWQPETSLQEGLSKTVDWYRKYGFQ